jgi:soluble lytic murein transglycosylase
MDARVPISRQNYIRFQARLVWVLVGLLFCLGLVDCWYEHHKEHRYDAQIGRLAQRYAIDPALVKAVIWRESRFNPRVRGRVGEIGLMQIRALTAQEWAKAESRQRLFEGNLFEPELNLQIGIWYLSKLIKRYSHTDVPAAYALADYNAGRNNVLRWNQGAAVTNSALFLDKITFPSTQQYVRSILQRSLKYQGQFTTRS